MDDERTVFNLDMHEERVSLKKGTYENWSGYALYSSRVGTMRLTVEAFPQTPIIMTSIGIQAKTTPTGLKPVESLILFTRSEILLPSFHRR